MTIHTEHPFDTPDEDRDPVRRLRGRIGGTVSLWTAGSGVERAGVYAEVVTPGAVSVDDALMVAESE